MPGRYEINEYQLPLDFTEEERERFNNVGFSDEFKRQILTQKEGGWGMVGTWKVTNRTKDGVAYTKIPVNESNMVDVGECYTGKIIDRLAAYEDSGLSPKEVQELTKAKKEETMDCQDCRYQKRGWLYHKCVTGAYQLRYSRRCFQWKKKFWWQRLFAL